MNPTTSFISMVSGSLAPTPGDPDYPHPSSAAARDTMRANRRVDTKPETRLRSLLHLAGLRFRRDYSVACESRKVHVDVAFPVAKLAVFVDGCFWHGCPRHHQAPKANASYWEAKLAMNRDRDRRINRALRKKGWTVLRVWEHTAPEEAAERVRVVRERLLVRG